MLGKRKRETIVSRKSRAKSEDSNSSGSDDVRAGNVFRHHFETKFVPLPLPNIATEKHPEEAVGDGYSVLEEVDSHSEGSVSSVWTGISDDRHETSTTVEVVDHAGTAPSETDDPIDKIFQRSFMSSKPPQSLDAPRAQRKPDSTTKDEDEEEDDKTNLKHDLDLQRLLRESHLLGQTKKASIPGAARHKATDLRLQSLGSKASLFTQERMPMSHRKGIQAKASSQDALRRRDAKENGIILEKPASKRNTIRDSRRDRGVDVPAVGKFRGGTLQLSRRDIASIQGPKRGVTKQRGRR